MEIVYKRLDELKPYENNPRNNADAIEPVKKSIEQFGFKVPMVITADGTIVTGHTRYEASKLLKLEEVPCVVADDLTDEQIRAFRIIDNKTSEYATWDMQLLEFELDNVDYDLGDFGFIQSNDNEIDYDNVQPYEDEYEPVDVEEPKVKRGQVYQLGQHRLMCGDSTNAEDVKKLMNGKQADLMFTDPPYNVNVSNSEGMTIENDNMDDEQFANFINSAMSNATNSLKKGGAFYIWYADGESINFRQACKNNDLDVKQCLIWVKNGFNFGRQDYKWKHEPCLYGWKKGESHYFVEEYNNPTVIEDFIDFSSMKKEEMKAMLEEIFSDKVATTVIKENKPLKNDLHPTMKPLRMCANLIRHSSKQNQLVLDLFGGSGSTMMACEQVGRICYMMEYDPRYAEVIIDRYQKLTGTEATLIEEGE